MNMISISYRIPFSTNGLTWLHYHNKEHVLDCREDKLMILNLTVSKAIRVMVSRPCWALGGRRPAFLAGGAAPSLFGRWRQDPPDGGVSINHLGYPAYICTPLCTSINQSNHSLQSTLLTYTSQWSWSKCTNSVFNIIGYLNDCTIWKRWLYVVIVQDVSQFPKGTKKILLVLRYLYWMTEEKYITMKHFSPEQVGQAMWKNICSEK